MLITVMPISHQPAYDQLMAIGSHQLPTSYKKLRKFSTYSQFIMYNLISNHRQIFNIYVNLIAHMQFLFITIVTAKA